jgi:hypothetical protein
LKKVQEKNKRVKAEEEKKRKELIEKGEYVDAKPSNLLEDEEDKDILFN